MPRQARIIIPGVPLHIIQRGNNRQACFYNDRDYSNYLEWLGEYSQKSNCTIHAYVLMTNHVHLLLTPKFQESAAELMKHLGQRYVQYFNRKYGRSGTLLEGRFRSTVVQQEMYMFACYKYIEMNPVRAGIVSDPEDYRWSSYRINAQGEKQGFIRPHQLYQDLAETDAERQRIYAEQFWHELETSEVVQIRSATNGNFVLGNEQFTAKIGKMFGQNVSPRKPGRPFI